MRTYCLFFLRLNIRGEMPIVDVLYPMKTLIFTYLVLAMASAELQAKAYFSNKEEMVAKAQVIAIVEIKNLKSLEPEKMAGNQQATVVPIKVLKGTLKSEEELFVPCFFPCAIVKLTPGKYLVFLERDKKVKRLQGFNWHLSYRPIVDGSVAWFSNNELNAGLQTTELEGVIKDITNLLKPD